MTLGTILLVLILLACPLMMLLMHRGGHKHRAAMDEARPSLDELRRRRGAIDDEIRSRQGEEATSDARETTDPVGTER